MIFSAPLIRGAQRQIKRLSRRCPAFAGLRLAILVVKSWIVPVDSGMGDPVAGMAKILPKIGK
jgi:hypothetical protein